MTNEINNEVFYTKLENNHNKRAFEITKNQEYLYGKKVLQPWHNFAKKIYIDPSCSVLEIGCGNGAFIETIKSKNKEAIDMDSFALEKVSKDVKTFLIDLDRYVDIDGNQGKYDIIYIFEVIEHTPDPLSFLRKCNILLKENGIIIGSTPNKNRWWISIFEREPFDYPPNHFITFSKNQLEASLKASNFKDALIKPAFYFQNPNHISYRVKIFLKMIGINYENKLTNYFSYILAIIVYPIFNIISLLPGKYLHHGFFARKSSNIL